MKIALAQTQPIKGDIDQNIRNHIHIAELASNEKCDIVVFSELSLTGYEPEIAVKNATTLEDSRFEELQHTSIDLNITIAAGLPLKSDKGVYISLVLFEPNKQPWIYSKQFLHEDEEPFFIPGNHSNGIILGSCNVGLAICYELSVDDHLEKSLQNGAQVYLTSVAKHSTGVKEASARLSNVAKRFNIQTMMVNCTGEFDGVQCSGNSSVWGTDGTLLARLDDNSQGLILFETNSQEVFTKTI